MVHYNATIKFNVEDCTWSKTYSGTETAIKNEAEDFLNTLVCRYIKDNRIKDPEEQDDIINDAGYEIIYDEELFSAMFAVMDAAGETVLGIYSTRTDAEEALYNECENEVYELLMTSDPMEVFGMEEFDYNGDFWYLMNDTMDVYKIEEVPVYGD